MCMTLKLQVIMIYIMLNASTYILNIVFEQRLKEIEHPALSKERTSNIDEAEYK